MQTPLFVIGNPRSGTSLLRLVLTCHSRIVIPPECGFIVWLKDAYRSWSRNDCHDRARRRAFVDDLVHCRKFETWGLTREAIEKSISAYQPTTYAELCSLIYLSYAGALKKQVDLWGDKNNFHINHLQDLLNIFPGARFIHIVRDGRDVACSYREVAVLNSSSKYAPDLPTDIGTIAEQWARNVECVFDFMDRLSNQATMVIKYENLVRNSEHTIRAICSWLQLDYEPSMMQFHVSNSAHGLEPKQTIDWKKRTLEPIGTQTVGRFSELLSKVEIAAFESRAGQSLARFGYTLETRRAHGQSK